MRSPRLRVVRGESRAAVRDLVRQLLDLALSADRAVFDDALAWLGYARKKDAAGGRR